MPGLSEAGGATAGSRGMAGTLLWPRSGQEGRDSHVCRRASTSRLIRGKWWRRMASMYLTRSLSSFNKAAESAPRRHVTVDGLLNSHGRRRWRQRLHGVPPSHFSLRRRHSSQLRRRSQRLSLWHVAAPDAAGRHHLTRAQPVAALVPPTDVSWWVLGSQAPCWTGSVCLCWRVARVGHFVGPCRSWSFILTGPVRSGT